MKSKITLVTLLFIFLNCSLIAQVLPERERATMVNRILKERFETVLPNLMYRTGIDLWVIIAREYNEDPVMRTMLPAEWLNARRRTILVFSYDEDKNKLDKMAVARYDIGENIKSVWNKEQEPDQWKALVEIIKDKDPQKIGINFSEDFNHADGLTKTDHENFMKVLPESFQKKVVSAEELAVGWIETRSSMEMQIYKELVSITHNLIKTAFSSAIIKPGKTTTEDVVWYLRQQVTNMGLDTWFHPTVDVQRPEKILKNEVDSFSSTQDQQTIHRGDLLHCDFGISYLRLNTDCQQLAYVLKNNEKDAPAYLKTALQAGNTLQDILIGQMKTGKTGNEILSESLEQAKTQGLTPSIYTHPLGSYGHSAGTTIGMWDSQDGVPGSGEYPLHEKTVYAIELNTTVNIPEWNKDIRIMLEEAGYWGKGSFEFVNGRQEELILIE